MRSSATSGTRCYRRRNPVPPASARSGRESARGGAIAASSAAWPWSSRMWPYLPRRALSATKSDPVLASHVVQRHRESPRPLPLFKAGAYLFGIARNRVLKHLERAPREVPLEPDSEANAEVHGSQADKLAHMQTPAAWAERSQLTEHVHEAVLGLPPDFREAVVLCELEELSYKEAARLLDCPIGTIRSRLHRARALLLAKLEMWRSVPRRATAR